MNNKIIFEFAYRFKFFFEPPRFKYIKKCLNHSKKNISNLTILDVGCGGRSFQFCKKWLSTNIYHGIDKEYWNGDKISYDGIDKLFLMDLDLCDLSELKDNFYDVIILSHVIEHLENGLKIIEGLASKLKIGGVIYVETPSLRTLNFPSAIGFMNFYDDPTHLRIYFDDEIIKTFQGNRIKIFRYGFRRDYLRILLISPFSIVINLIYFLPFKKRLCSWGLWDLFGVARIWIGIKVQ